MKRTVCVIGSVIGALAAGVVGFGSSGSATAGGNLPGFTRATVPPGFDQYMVFIADGLVPDTTAGVLLGDDTFHVDVMGRTQAEIDAVQAEAVQLFNDRYGIPNADNNPDIDFHIFSVDPAVNYRAYVIGGEKVPEEGWEVRDGGFLAFVSNPAGIVLGGDFAGLHVPEGTGFVLGDYNVKRTRANGQEIEPLIIRFRGAAPGLPPTFAVPQTVFCDTTSAEFGEGIAQGSAGNTPVGGGMINPNYRNIITFNANGGI